MELEDLRREPTRTGKPGEASLTNSEWKLELPLVGLWQFLKSFQRDNGE